MLVTRPNATGFAPVEKTIGMTNLVSMKGLEHLPNLRHVTSMHVHAEERRRQEERERLQIERDFEKLTREQTGRGSLLNFVRYFWHSLESKTRPLVEGWPLEAITLHLEALTFNPQQPAC